MTKRKGQPVGRKKLYPSRITLPLSREMLAAIDAARGKVPRVDYIRLALGRALKARRGRNS